MTARSDLGTLEASGLIEIAALQPELEYLFRHALVQDAAYASLLKQERRTLHRAAAETILALHPGRERELAAVVGMHFEQAGDSERAADNLVIAGEQALEHFANQEAIAFFRRAGALADVSRVDLRLRAAVGSAKAGWTYSESATDIDQLDAVLKDEDRADRRLVAEAYFWLAFLRRQRGEVPESSPPLKHALDRAVEIGVSLNDASSAALPKALMGSYVAFTGKLRQGAREMSEALNAIETTGDAVSMAIVSDFLALAYARLGEFAAAEQTIARGMHFAANGDPIAQVDVFGAASLAQNDATAAKVPLERGNELARVTSMAPMRTLLQGLLGSTRARLGDMPGGVEQWNEALVAARGMNDRYGEAQTLWGRGRTYAAQPNSDLAAALADLDRAAELFDAMEARPSLARALHDRGQVLSSLGRTEEAGEAERRSTELRTELGLRDMPLA